MNATLNTIDAESLFNSVEQELLRRRDMGDVPFVFSQQFEKGLQSAVKGWWSIYHESQAARLGQNRTAVQRNEHAPAKPLTRLGLVTSLEEIQELLDMEALYEWRPSPQHEAYAVSLLDKLIAYYH